jgi:hypothetical protein
VQIRDEDMQMVRDFLVAHKAPEFVKGHFENLVDEYAKEAARAEELKDADDELERVKNELDDALEDARSANEAADEVAREHETLLVDLRDWFDRVLIYKQPMSSPTKLIRRIEDALRC